MGKRPKEGLKTGAWTPVEDKLLADYIKIHGEGRWNNIPEKAGLNRSGKSCRLRWLNYLRPDIKRGNITNEEEEHIIRLHKLLGNRWSLIAGRLPGRTDNESKNYWNTKLGRKVLNHPNAASNHKQSKDKKNKKMKMKKKMKHVECNKVFLSPPQNEAEALVPTGVGDDFATPYRAIESQSYDELSLFVPEEDELMGFVMDLNDTELCGSDQLLSSELSLFCDFDNEIVGEGTEDLSPSSVQPLFYPPPAEEMQMLKD